MNKPRTAEYRRRTSRRDKSFQKRSTKQLRHALEWAEQAVLQAHRSGIKVPASHFGFIEAVKAEIQARTTANDPRPRRDPNELAAATLVGPNRYELGSHEEAKLFASVLRHHGHSVERVGRLVRTAKSVPWADIEWADANAFKYGGRLASHASRPSHWRI